MGLAMYNDPYSDPKAWESSFQKYLENAKTLEALQEKSFYELSINLSQNRIINTNIPGG